MNRNTLIFTNMRRLSRIRLFSSIRHNLLIFALVLLPIGNLVMYAQDGQNDDVDAQGSTDSCSDETLACRGHGPSDSR